MGVETGQFIIRIADVKEKEALANLMQFYFYDFSEFINIDPTENGRFKDYKYFDHYWQEAKRFPYFIEQDGKFAGFALVREVMEEGEPYWSMAEFFIMKKYRKTGLGKRAAQELFKKHTGRWEVLQIEKNKPAQAFWRKVIGEFTDGNFDERVEENKDIVQTFVSR